MKHVRCWDDLEKFGIIPLTSESCGLSWRILFDATETGRRALARLFGIPNLKLAEAWNRGTATDRHVGSIMMTPDMLATSSAGVRVVGPSERRELASPMSERTLIGSPSSTVSRAWVVVQFEIHLPGR